MEIKVGDKFTRTHDSDSGDSWEIFYTVTKVTAKFVWVVDDRFASDPVRSTPMKLKVYSDPSWRNGLPRVVPTYCGSAFLKTA
jgi:hypothetical protein